MAGPRKRSEMQIITENKYARLVEVEGNEYPPDLKVGGPADVTQLTATFWNEQRVRYLDREGEIYTLTSSLVPPRVKLRVYTCIQAGVFTWEWVQDHNLLVLFARTNMIVSVSMQVLEVIKERVIVSCCLDDVFLALSSSSTRMPETHMRVVLGPRHLLANVASALHRFFFVLPAARSSRRLFSNCCR